MQPAHHNPQAATAKPSYKPTIESFIVLLQDTFGESIRYNKLATSPQQLVDGEWVKWTDTDDAALRAYFQSQWDMYHKQHLSDAFLIFLRNNTVNPLTDLINGLEWDGVSRIEQCLHVLTGCDDTPYTREVSRLIFAGGIHRAYRPGCKFDDVAVLVGKQGGGKSTFVRMLAMEDEFFREVNTFDGTESVEALFGGWIIEIPEMLATARAKEVEAVKAYITRQKDTYRVPYDRYTNQLPRRCIFVGTTNNPQFLADRTGNRRFYPVTCKKTGFDVLDKEDEYREYIRQCWAEAKHLFDEGKLKPYPNRDLMADIQEQQESAMEDDPREGLIRDYCDKKKHVGDKVCTLELWQFALQQDPTIKLPTRRDAIDITQIMQRMPGWERVPQATRVGGYGVVKAFVKVFDVVDKPPDCPF